MKQVVQIYSSEMSNQKNKTIEYWDAFYSSVSSEVNANHFASTGEGEPSGISAGGKADFENDEIPSSDLEWIVPYSVVLDTILNLLPPSDHSNQSQSPNKSPKKNVHLLEIGCGVSQLSISLLRRLLLCRQGANVYDRIYNVVATDVSSVCIDRNRERDTLYVSLIRKEGHSFRYEVLDVLNYDASSPHNQQYDMILDKGTLDTFLFRSKRTNKGSATHPPLLTPLLNNIHRWLRCGHEAKYLIITPRAKIKSMRDFNGFASVRRIKLDIATLSGNVILVKGNSENSKQSKSEVYLYVCIKNDIYYPEHDAPYRENGNTKDESLCSKCGISFKEFLGKVDSKDHGEVVCERRWKNHCVHCKI